jgi:hypothetical protein
VEITPRIVLFLKQKGDEMSIVVVAFSLQRNKKTKTRQ